MFGRNGNRLGGAALATPVAGALGLAARVLPVALVSRGAAAVSAAAPTPRPSGCQGAITGSLSAAKMETGQTVTATTRVEPICQACSGGIKSAKTRQGGSDDPAWQ